LRALVMWDAGAALVARARLESREGRGMLASARDGRADVPEASIRVRMTRGTHARRMAPDVAASGIASKLGILYPTPQGMAIAATPAPLASSP